MSEFLAGVALFLLLNIAVGLVRVVRGPTSADRMLAAQLFGTTGIAIMLILGVSAGIPAALDVALIFALLAVLSTLAFVRRIGPMIRHGSTSGERSQVPSDSSRGGREG